MILLFNILACSKDNDLDVSNTEVIPITENSETSDLEKIESETMLENELVYVKSETLTENIDILNKTLEEEYGISFTVSSVEEYEKTNQSDWTLVLEDNRVGIDTATWKFDYESNSEESKYMDAILSTLIFFCGEQMGNSLWLLNGDLFDGGADETLYGFEHDGSQAVILMVMW